MQLHNKRNKLSKIHSNDYVFVKYNQALKQQYKLHDTIDPISLKEIDDGNVWLMGRMDDYNDSEQDDLVFYNLQWGAVLKATGVGKTIHNTRWTPESVKMSRYPSLKFWSRVDIDEEEANLDETKDADDANYKSNDDEDEDDVALLDDDDV